MISSFSAATARWVFPTPHVPIYNKPKSSGYSSIHSLVSFKARASDEVSVSKLYKLQFLNLSGIRADTRFCSTRVDFLQEQGRTPLPSTNSHPVPLHLGHGDALKSKSSACIDQL